MSDGASAGASAQSGPAPLVLVIDDDADALAICERALRAAGYRTATAASGEAGLGLLAQVDAGLVVLDLAMPGLDGFAVAEAIRRSGTTAPILIFTGLPREQAARARAVGGTDVCSKPIEPQRFVAAVRRLCPLTAEEIR